MSNSNVRSTRAERGALSLKEVLASGLPASLGSANPPDRYMVPAVFSRAPSAREVALLEGERTAARLRAAHYENVTLKVSDRRLEIRETNLEELRDGLAVTVARILSDATSIENEEDASRLAAAEANASAELVRARAVAAEAAAIRFTVPESATTPQ